MLFVLTHRTADQPAPETGFRFVSDLTRRRRGVLVPVPAELADGLPESTAPQSDGLAIVIADLGKDHAARRLTTPQCRLCSLGRRKEWSRSYVVAEPRSPPFSAPRRRADGLFLDGAHRKARTSAPNLLPEA
ncbi:hypothetical protein Adu01nite_34130 [Paractinoplanes durhamensis]|uniref:Uncharacterized protein n=1 Tax=Paractinoplanes durhamensis TaxID=113563 RepID=A0ABQ3YWW9_9ACTN|nr:hypothetical protein Adu01nite_34130 [Actinoplanes durhamensis]